MKTTLLKRNGLLAPKGKVGKSMLILFVVLSFLKTVSYAQNLIPNPSFELRDSCPTGWHEGFPYPSYGPLFAQNWYTPNAGTSDYFNVCSPLIPPNMGLPVSVPVNFVGYQQPRTGDAYAGGLVGNQGNEYIESPLSTPLINGHHYFVSFWLNLADLSAGTADRFGAYFSTTALELPSNVLLDMYTPQVESPAGLRFTDSLNWTAISNTFTAAGNERWVTFGNFHNVNDLDTVQFEPNGGFGYRDMYFLYDDICVLDMDGMPSEFATKDTSLCGSATITLSTQNGLEHAVWNDGFAGNAKTIGAPGVYWATSVNVNTCSLHTDTFKVSGLGGTSTIDIGNDTAICLGETLTLQPKTGTYDNYKWSTGATTASISVSAPGVYALAVSSDCVEAKDSIRIQLLDHCQCLFMPNAFSPNNDGLNDKLQVGSICPIGYFQLSIYNRYGEKVFSSNSLTSAWDGLYKGKYADVGTYFYNIKYSGANSTSNVIELKGDVALLR